MRFYHYGKKSLRIHLLIMVNLILDDYLMGRITITNGKIISTLARKREKLNPAKNAEMHSTFKYEQC